MTARFLFVLSPERSGSTLLAAALGAHESIVAPPELHLLRYPSVRAWRAGYPAAGRSLEALLADAPMERPDGLDSLETLDLYRALAIRAPVDWIVDKTPAYARSQEALRRTSALRGHYLWLVRHPLAVAVSRQRTAARMRGEANTGLWARLKHPAYRLREHIRTATGSTSRKLAADWVDVHRRIRSFLAGVPQERWLRLQFEDLVSAPESELQRVCGLLDLPFDHAMLAPGAHAPEALAWGIGDGTLRDRRGFEASRAGAWREIASDDDLPEEARALYAEIGPAAASRP